MEAWHTTDAACVSRIEQGFKGLFKGAGARVLFFMPSQAISIASFDLKLPPSNRYMQALCREKDYCLFCRRIYFWLGAIGHDAKRWLESSRKTAS